MLSLNSSLPKSPYLRLAVARIALAALGLIALPLLRPDLDAASFALYGDPNFPFGATPPDGTAMAGAIQARLGIPITVVSALTNEDTTFSPLLADSQAPPFYVYGPSATGTIKNLNLNAPIVTGLTSGLLRSDGFDADNCGDFVPRFVLRLFSATQFYDVLVRYTTCSGMANVLWSFVQISSPRAIATLTPSPGPSPFPVQLVSTVSRFIHGALGAFDVNLPLAGPPGIECRRTNGAPGSYSIVFNFRNPLNSVYSAAVTSGVGRVHDSGIALDPHQYIVNLVNVSNRQSVIVTLNFVQDSVGHVSNTVNAAMSVLIGDTGDNGNVGTADVRQVQGQVGQPVTPMNFRDDLNHDGFIDVNDVTIVKRQKGASLPRAAVSP